MALFLKKVRQVLANGALGLMQQIFRDFMHDQGTDALRKHPSQYAEKLWRSDEHEPLEAVLLVRLRQLVGDLTGKRFCFVLAGSTLPTGCVMRNGSAALASRRGVIEEAAGPVRLEIAIVEVRIGIGQPARQMQRIIEPLDVIKARFGLVGQYDSGWHKT